jgi:predicted MFS family arabinose efflux permease
MAYASVTSIIGPSVSPIVGGLLSQYLGWHWIFWFLAIFSAAFCVPFLLFFPETCRKVVGDGSIPPPRLNWSLTTVIREKRRKKAGIEIDKEQQEALRKAYRLTFPNPVGSLKLFGHPAAAFILLSNALLFAFFYLVLGSLPSTFKAVYGFDDLKISFTMLPFAGGVILSAFSTGKLMDWNYRRHAKRIGFPLVKNRQTDLTNFPIERVRLEIAMPLLLFGAVIIVIYGWLLEAKTALAGPLIMLFFSGYSLIASFQSTSLLLIDMYPDSPATASAANNLARCLLAACSAAAVNPMIKAMGTGWTYTLVGIIWTVDSALLLLLIKFGPKWRRQQKEQKEKRESLKREKQESDEAKKAES